MTLEMRDQTHTIQTADGWETMKLGQLFKTHPGVQQIIRFRSDIYDVLGGRLEHGLNLFNTPNPINDPLISEYASGIRSQGLICKIHGPEGIIDGESLKVVNVLEMRNLTREDIVRAGLHRDSIPEPTTIEDLYTWLSGKFYGGMDISHEDELLFRRIKIDD